MVEHSCLWPFYLDFCSKRAVKVHQLSQDGLPFLFHLKNVFKKLFERDLAVKWSKESQPPMPTSSYLSKDGRNNTKDYLKERKSERREIKSIISGRNRRRGRNDRLLPVQLLLRQGDHEVSAHQREAWNHPELGKLECKYSQVFVEKQKSVKLQFRNSFHYFWSFQKALRDFTTNKCGK